jgi:hypothetical protein
VVGTVIDGENAQWSTRVPDPAAEVAPANRPASVTTVVDAGDGK